MRSCQATQPVQRQSGEFRSGCCSKGNAFAQTHGLCSLCQVGNNEKSQKNLAFANKETKSNRSHTKAADPTRRPKPSVQKAPAMHDSNLERCAALPPLLLAFAMRMCMTADEAVHVYRRLCPQRRFNKAIVHALADRNGLFALECAPPHLLDSFTIVHAAVKNNGLALQHASERLKDNPLIVLRATKQCGLSLKFASARFRANKKLVLDALRSFHVDKNTNNNSSSSRSSSKPQSNSSNTRLLFEQVHPDLQNDFDVVLSAVGNDGHSLTHASPKMRNNRQVAAAAVNQAPLALRHASTNLQSDRDFVINAVSKNGLALAFASQLCRADAGVVLAALVNNGFALQYASDALKRQTHLVLAAVRQNGNALLFASDECKNSMDVVLEAINSNFEAVRFASTEMQQTPQVKLRVCAARHNHQTNNTCGRTTTAMLHSNSETL